MTTTQPEPEEGNAKEERKENTNTTPPARSGRNPEEAREKKSGRTMGQKPTRGGGGGRKHLTQPSRREPNLCCRVNPINGGTVVPTLNLVHN